MQTGAMGTAVEAPPCSRCSTPPPVLFLLATLAMTTFSTAMLCAAIMTDHWEHITWDRDELEKLTNGSIHWLLDGSVARMGSRGTRGGAFLVPVHGGIWTLCVSLTEPEMRLLGRVGFPKGTALNGGCKNYLAGSDGVRGEEQRADWQHRMQNLSISCSLVCLIILGSAALVGAFGVCAKQISAVLVTGVMYLLAALFALFTLMIIHFKRHQGRALLEGASADNSADGVLGGGKTGAVLPLLGARQFTTSWSLDLGWGGVSLCTITSLLWILLSKIMRFNPLSAMI